MTGVASSTVGGWSRAWYDEWPQTRSGSELFAPRKTELGRAPEPPIGRGQDRTSFGGGRVTAVVLF